ncbi:MAG: EFR1 family ferrodoxin [Brevinematia bacterium]
MKILILYFSGAGSTKYFCDIISEEIKSFAEISKLPVEEAMSKELPDHNVLLAMFPVYALDAPKIFKDYISSLPKVDGKGVYLICTHGGGPGNALRKIHKILALKGYKLLGFSELFTIDSLIVFFVKEDSSLLKILEKKRLKSIEKAKKFAKKIEAELIEYQKDPNRSAGKIRLPFRLYDIVIYPMIQFLYNLGKKHLWKYFWVDENCTSCAKCVNICPLKNIYFSESKVKFGGNCIFCLRCLHNCPTKSIQVGKLTLGKYRLNYYK